MIQSCINNATCNSVDYEAYITTQASASCQHDTRSMFTTAIVANTGWEHWSRCIGLYSFIR